MTSQADIIEVLKTVVDPELFIDVWTLGLIYGLEVQGTTANIRMTFTSMACPAGPQLLSEIKQKVEELPDITVANVEVVFDPPWQPSEELKAMLGIG